MAPFAKFTIIAFKKQNISAPCDKTYSIKLRVKKYMSTCFHVLSKKANEQNYGPTPQLMKK